MNLDKPVQEKWSNFPETRNRFFKLLKENNPSGVILLSGDIHYAEILENSCAGLRNPLFEITASGMTHSCGKRHENSWKPILILI